MDHKKYPAHKSDPFYNFSGSVALYVSDSTKQTAHKNHSLGNRTTLVARIDGKRRLHVMFLIH